MEVKILCSMMKLSSGANRRGLLIVLEGCDRSGKTTVCRQLVSRLNDEKLPARAMRFPDRTTGVGKVIDEYLRQQKSLDDRAVHLLFSSNRWEKSGEIREALDRGETLVIDR